MWGVGLPSVILNLIALANLDMFNVLLLLPSLLFSVSAMIGPFLMKPREGNTIGNRVVLPKALAWAASLVFFTFVSMLIASGGGYNFLGGGLFLVIAGFLLWRAARFAWHRMALRRGEVRLKTLLQRCGLDEDTVGPLQAQLIQNAADSSKVGSLLDDAEVQSDNRPKIERLIQRKILPARRNPTELMKRSIWANNRWLGEFKRSFSLSFFVLLWFFIVPVPGLFVFSAQNFNISMPLNIIMPSIVGSVFVILAGYWLGRLIQWFDRSGARESSLHARAAKAFRSFQQIASQPTGFTDQEISAIYARFIDLKIYLDQGSYAYLRGSLESIESMLATKSQKPRSGAS